MYGALPGARSPPWKPRVNAPWRGEDACSWSRPSKTEAFLSQRPVCPSSKVASPLSGTFLTYKSDHDSLAPKPHTAPHLPLEESPNLSLFPSQSHSPHATFCFGHPPLPRQVERYLSPPASSGLPSSRVSALPSCVAVGAWLLAAGLNFLF